MSKYEAATRDPVWYVCPRWGMRELVNNRSAQVARKRDGDEHNREKGVNLVVG